MLDVALIMNPVEARQEIAQPILSGSHAQNVRRARGTVIGAPHRMQRMELRARRRLDQTVDRAQVIRQAAQRRGLTGEHPS